MRGDPWRGCHYPHPSGHCPGCVSLPEFLRDRYDEDEKDANQLAVDLDRWDREGAANGPDGTQGSIVASTLRGGAFDPARVLADIEAKRLIVEACTTPLPQLGIPPEQWDRVPTDRDDVLRLLALPYAEHPDWREEWRPSASRGVDVSTLGPSEHGSNGGQAGSP